MPALDLWKVRETTKAMLDEISDMVRGVTPADYLPAKRFLESVAYEANKPLGNYASSASAQAWRPRNLR